MMPLSITNAKNTPGDGWKYVLSVSKSVNAVNTDMASLALREFVAYVQFNE